MSSISFGQFPEEHMNQLTKLNCELSDTWVIDIDFDETPYSNIDIGLWNYKTANDNGANYGLSINLFEIKYKDDIIALEGSGYPLSGCIYLETKSYFVIIDYSFPKSVELFNNLIPILVDELIIFFESRKEIL